MSTTTVSRWIAAPPADVFAALLDPSLIPQWRVPDGMSGVVHRFEPVAGGTFRVSLTYEEPTASGKSSAHTDTYAGTFDEIVPASRIVERLWFETHDPAMTGEMRITTTIRPERGGTMLIGVHDDLPAGVSPVDNVVGWEQALAKLARLVEASLPGYEPHA